MPCTVIQPPPTPKVKTPRGKRGKGKLKGIYRLAFFHGWSIAIFSGLFLLSSILGLDFLGTLVSGLITFAGYRESQSHKGTLLFAIQGESITLITILIYCTWQIFFFNIGAYLSQPQYGALFQPYSAHEVEELMVELGTYTDWFYMAVIVSTIIYQAVFLSLYTKHYRRATAVTYT
jgi:hypothetical protein